MIHSRPATKEYLKNYDAIFTKQLDCGCEDQVTYRISTAHSPAGSELAYRATCKEFPDLVAEAMEPFEAHQKLEAMIQEQLKAA